MQNIAYIHNGSKVICVFLKLRLDMDGCGEMCCGEVWHGVPLLSWASRCISSWLGFGWGCSQHLMAYCCVSSRAIQVTSNKVQSDVIGYDVMMFDAIQYHAILKIQANLVCVV